MTHRRSYLLAFVTFALGLLVGLLTPRAGAYAPANRVLTAQEAKVQVAREAFTAEPNFRHAHRLALALILLRQDQQRERETNPRATVLPAAVPHDAALEAQSLAQTDTERRLAQILVTRAGEQGE